MNKGEQKIGKRMLDMQFTRQETHGRSKRRFLVGLCEDMKVVGVTAEAAYDRAGWRKAICCGDPLMG